MDMWMGRFQKSSLKRKRGSSWSGVHFQGYVDGKVSESALIKGVLSHHGGLSSGILFVYRYGKMQSNGVEKDHVNVTPSSLI